MSKLFGKYPLMAARVKSARLEAGFTQVKLGEAVGISHALISSYEKGLMQPRLENLVKMAEVMFKPLRYFVEEDTDQVMIEVKYKNIERRLIEMTKKFKEVNQEFEDLKGVLKKLGINYDRGKK